MLKKILVLSIAGLALAFSGAQVLAQTTDPNAQNQDTTNDTNGTPTGAPNTGMGSTAYK